MTTPPSVVDPTAQIRLSQYAETVQATSKPISQECGLVEDWEVLRLDDRETQGRDRYLSEYEIISKPSRFFKIGRVFKVLWTEPAGDTGNTFEDAIAYTTPSKFGESAFTKVRFFVVVREMQNCSLCLPLNTHNRQGATKTGVRSQDYAAVYVQGSQPFVAPGESITKSPFPIVVENSMERIDPMSRLNFGRVYTVEHNLKVSKVGRIPQEHIPLLEEYFMENLTATKHRSRDAEVYQPTRLLPTEPRVYSSSSLTATSLPSTDFEHGHNSSLGYRRTDRPHEKLDKSYKVRNYDYKKFFLPGRVFATLWLHTLGETTTDRDQLTSTSIVVFGERIHAKIRRFVVVRLGDRCCTCLPLITYNGKGHTKSGIVLNDHGLIYSGTRPKSISGLRSAPLKVKLASGVEALGDSTLINYGRPYTVETNAKVKDIGELDSESQRVLRRYFKEVNFTNADEDTSYSSIQPVTTDNTYSSLSLSSNPQVPSPATIPLFQSPAGVEHPGTICRACFGYLSNEQVVGGNLASRCWSCGKYLRTAEEHNLYYGDFANSNSTNSTASGGNYISTIEQDYGNFTDIPASGDNYISTAKQEYGNFTNITASGDDDGIAAAYPFSTSYQVMGGVSGAGLSGPEPVQYYDNDSDIGLPKVEETARSHDERRKTIYDKYIDEPELPSLEVATSLRRRHRGSCSHDDRRRYDRRRH